MSATVVGIARPSRRYGAGFWTIALAFLAVMSLSAAPSPLHGLYQLHDGFSTFTLTVVYATYAVGTMLSLVFVGHLSDWYGRRRVLVPAVALAAVSAAVFLVWQQLPGLLVGRLLVAIAVGAVTATATAWMAELHAARRSRISSTGAQLISTAVNIGGIGLGPLIAGLLAQWVGHPLRVPYVVLLIALLIALVGVAATPETRAARVPRPRYRPQRIVVPADARGQFLAAATSFFLGFASVGLFVGLAGTFLAGTLHETSHALAGATVFLVLASGVASQALTQGLRLRSRLALGMALMVAGLTLMVVDAWLSTPQLAWFMVAGALVGAGGGATLQGSLGTVAAIAPPDGRAEALAGLFAAGYAGLSLPVVGVGVALQLVSPRVALLTFAALVIAAMALVAPRLLGDGGRAAGPAPAAA
jgi:MFS family permease